MRDALTLQIREFLEDGRYFDKVRILPGKPADGDLVLRFRFEHFNQTRDVHPAYFPLALLTLALYPYFGGPVFVDTSHLEGELRVATSDGRELAAVTAKEENSYSVSIYSSHYALPTGIEPRTAAVQDLVDRAMEELHKRGGAQP